MKSLYYYNPIVVTDKMKGIDEWRKLYRYLPLAVGICDRTESFQQPLRLTIADTCKLPTLRTTNLSYTDCCDNRAKELFDLSEATAKPLRVYWSGGIDSTNILVSFLRNYSIAQLKDKIKVVMNSKSMMENPKFYHDYVLPNFELISSEFTPWMFDGKAIIVTGELNDQLFGSDMMRNYLITDGADKLNAKFSRDDMFEYIDRKIQDARISNLMIDGILTSAKTYGLELEKNSDFFWWYNIGFKWQNVHYRIYMLTIPSQVPNITKEWDEQHMKHFYETDDFQLWSFNNPDIRVIPSWKDYKNIAKQDIFAFNNDEDYLMNKVKTGSLTNVYKYRIIGEAFNDAHEIIAEFNPNDYYNPNNPFTM